MTHQFRWGWEEVLFDQREIVSAEATLQLEQSGHDVRAIL
jgi:hypothetical protein